MKWIKWLALIIFISILINSKAEEHGFCIKKMAFVSDLYTEQQLIDQAIAYKIKRIPGAIGSRDGNHIKIIPYLSVEEFKEKNPNCCTLTSQLPEGGPGEWYRYVELSYLEYYENDIRPPKEYGGFIPYDACGEIPLKR